MMAKNAKIKVIKRGEAVPAAPKAKVSTDPKRHAAREMVSTVKNWVSDFQARKRDETKAAIETFLVTKSQQPSEV
jgi:hypothetical protein